MIAGSLRVPLPSCGRDRRLRGLQAAREPVAHRRAAVGDHALERAVDRAAVGRRRDDLLGVVGERHEPEAEVVGRLVDEHLGRVDGRGQAAGIDVVGAHRARDVVDEHDGRRALRRGDAALRAREREDQRGDARAAAGRRAGAGASPGRAVIRLGSSAGLPNAAASRRAPALHREVRQQRDGQQREAEQDGRLAEAHGRFLARRRRGAPARRRWRLVTGGSASAGRRGRRAAGIARAPCARRPRRGRARRRPSRCGASGRRGAGGRRGRAASRRRSRARGGRRPRGAAPRRPPRARPPRPP